MPAGSIRARVRAEMVTEIKAVARRHLATDGANLSLRAVARDMGMVSSALYRYFASRDDLLTALIIDAYNALGAAVEKADAAVGERGDFRGRFLILGRAVRQWALANPAEYALIFGSPVPGYAAPANTVVAAQRTPDVLLGILVDGLAGIAVRAPAAELAPALRADMTAARDAIAPSLPPDVFALGTIAWIHIFGAVSFELFGQLNNVIDARDDYFDYQLRQIADLVGLG
ncbi:MAG TPA: WHG domain-containing protein [Micromonosporaceae bacterium]|jgi:AcrR family transcriptional regulator